MVSVMKEIGNNSKGSLNLRESLEKIRNSLKPISFSLEDYTVKIKTTEANSFLGLTTVKEDKIFIYLSKVAKEYYPNILIHEINEGILFLVLKKLRENLEKNKNITNITHYLVSKSLNQYESLDEKKIDPIKNYLESDKLPIIDRKEERRE